MQECDKDIQEQANHPCTVVSDQSETTRTTTHSRPMEPTMQTYEDVAKYTVSILARGPIDARA
eukprot:10300012-Prorocentrum_lima.AAC.1